MPKAPAKIAAAVRSRRPTARSRKPSPLPRYIEIRQRRLPAILSAALKQVRKRAGMTQAEVAEAIATHPEVYGRMERGGVMPSIPTLMRLCLTLGCGPHELMGFSPVAPFQNAPGASTVPPGLNDTPEKQRMLRLLGRLEQVQLKLILRLVVCLARAR